MLRRLLLRLVLLLLPGLVRADVDPYPQDDTLRLNHVQAIGTHNSDHLLSPLYPNGPPAMFDYEHAPLDVQLDEQGVRKFELDVYWDLDFGIFRVHHENRFDSETSCETLQLCLEILRDWSLAHRGHHPILIMIEPKGIHSEFTLSDDPICGSARVRDLPLRRARRRNPRRVGAGVRHGSAGHARRGARRAREPA